MIDVRKYLLSTLLFCSVLPLIISKQARSNEPDAAELVRDVRESEMWIHDFNSLYIRADVKWTQTPAKVAKRRQEIIEQFDVDDPNEKRFSDLRERHNDILEYAVDRRRVRYLTDDPGYWRQLKIWDGNELRIHEKYYYHAHEFYVLDNKIGERIFHELFACYYGWPRSQPHSFWWDTKDVNQLMDSYGRPEKFKLTGQQLFREIPCHVLEYDVSANLTFRWFVGQSDHLLHGIQTCRNNRVAIEHWMLNYRETAPSGWFPAKTGWSFYEEDQPGKNNLKSTCDINVIEFRLNEPLADDLFQMTFKDGLDVQDIRSDQIITYTYKSPLTGKVFPSLEGIDIDFDSMRASGKLILFCFLDCQQRPSRNCINQLRINSQYLKSNDIAIVAIHASKIEQAKLDKWVKENEVDFPVGMIQADEEKTRFTWGVKSLPWLILTNAEHIVSDEGFSIDELDEKVKECVNAEKK